MVAALGMLVGKSSVNDWQARLTAAVNEYRNVPGKWGQHDCLLWADKCIEARYGIAPVAYLNLNYKTARGAMRLLLKNGFNDPLEIMQGLFGEPRDSAHALHGDIVAVDAHKLGCNAEELRIGYSLGVCLGVISFFVGDDGLVPIPTREVEYCYG